MTEESTAVDAIETATAKPKSGWLNMLVDYGPLLVFLAVFKLYPVPADSQFGEIAPVIYGTIAFMVAAVIALAFSKFKLGHVSPMLMLSTALIVGFGALTVFFGDPRFVQLKPTIIYGFFGVMLLGGFFMGKALLKVLLEAAFEGVDEQGWLKISRNFGIFFLALAGLNEGLVAYMSFEGWLWAKFWVFMPLSLIFTMANLPMLLKHGLDIGQEDEAAEDETPKA
ncbi:septation protein IspZ [Erythrobacter sp. WH158]|uniref:Inner membrane-spanning protein YciB n=1 Tax=Erythrobacter crassostreae TaxID=2828328 RepID=A0A9X1F4I4_9SPHN|nr:inner membrane-spanning protein YciB [Erythrobacter crassostrea]MBV7259684.1 septation protein IspZ [Erythrobacter crassostrea]